jgi:putative restriction endonuclease
MQPDDLLHRVEGLNTDRSGDRRAPHKPLLLLIAISKLLRGHRRLSFSEIEGQLLPLLTAYAPPVASRHQPELPYWHLRSDDLWDVEGASQFPRQKGGFPRLAAIRSSTGGLPDDVAGLLESDAGSVSRVVRALLEEHVPPSVHDDILASVGLDIEALTARSDGVPKPTSRARDPGFRDSVLRAYEHRCAFSGFRAALAGTYFGCEAAHVQWHAYDGPDVVANGVALEPTIHKLSDARAWSLIDDRRILVSANYTGTDEAVARLRAHHGRPLHSPLPGNARVSPAFIRWHRDAKLGGVFREPALPL